MAVSFVSDTTIQTAAASSISIPAPASTGAGNLLVACIVGYDTSSQTVTGPSGWTQAVASAVGGTNVQTWIWYKVATASEPGSYTFTISGSLPDCGGWIGQYTGVNQSSPIDVTSSGAGNSITPSVPALTLAKAGELVVTSFALQFGGFTMGTPTGMTSRGSSSSNICLNVFDEVFNAAGSEGPFSASMNSSGAWAVAGIAINPGTSGFFAFT